MVATCDTRAGPCHRRAQKPCLLLWALHPQRMSANSDVPGNIASLKGHGLALVVKQSFYPQLCFLSQRQDIKACVNHFATPPAKRLEFKRHNVWSQSCSEDGLTASPLLSINSITPGRALSTSASTSVYPLPSSKAHTRPHVTSEAQERKKKQDCACAVCLQAGHVFEI